MSLQMVPIFLKSSYNRKHLLVVNLIVLFMGIEQLGIKGNWVPQLVSWVKLGQDCSSGKVTGICLQSERVYIIRNPQNRGRGKSLFQAIERLFLFLAPYPRLIFLGQ